MFDIDKSSTILVSNSYLSIINQHHIRKIITQKREKRTMKTFKKLIADGLKTVSEIFPWDLEELMEAESPLLLLDIREPYEFDKVHIKGSMNVPRGILESACDYGYDETVPELVRARDKDIIVICRSGNRSVLAAQTMQLMGYQSTKSLKTGVKGWNEYELPLQDIQGQLVDIDTAEAILAPKVRPDQMPPKKKSALRGH
jgi:rhodanese-related sulfurtransferase